MDDKFIQALHSELSSSYELGTVEEFGKKLASDDVFRKALFEDASKTLDLGDYATFEGQVKKKLSTEDYLPTFDNLSKSFQKRQKDKEPFSVVPPQTKQVKYEDTLPEDVTIEAVNKADKSRMDYLSGEAKKIEAGVIERVRQEATALSEKYEGAELEKKLDDLYELRSGEMQKAVETLAGETQYKYIDKDVTNYSDLFGNILDSNNAHGQKVQQIADLRQSILNSIPEEGRAVVKGELNRLISDLATQSPMGQQFLLKTSVATTRDKLIAAHDKLKAETDKKLQAAGIDPNAIATAPPMVEKEVDELSRLQGAIDFMNRALDVPESKEGAIGDAFKSELGNILTAGVSGLLESLEVMQSARRENPTEADKALVDAYGQLQQLQGMASENVDRYRRAKSLVGSIPYMEQFLLTGGVGDLASATARKVGESVLKKGIKKRIAQAAVKRLVEPVTEGAISMIGRVPIMPMTYKNIAEAGVALKEEDGKFVVDPAQMPTIGEAIGRGVYKSATEVFSESLGGVFALPKWKWVDKIITPSAKKLFTRVGMQNPFGEYGEEIFANLFQGEKIDRQFLGDLLMTIPIMTGGFAVLSTPAIISDLKMAKKKVPNAPEVEKLIRAKDEQGLLDLVTETVTGKTQAETLDIVEGVGAMVQENVMDEMTTPKVDSGASDIAPRIEGKTESGTQVSPEGDMPTLTTPSELNTGEIQGDVIPVKRISELREQSHTKGVFADETGKLYKSVEIKGGETMEHEVIAQNQDLSIMPAVGNIRNTSEGRAFEIERLSPLEEEDNITLDEYRTIVADAKKLDDRNIFVSESPDLARDKNGAVKLLDFSMSRNKAKAEKGDTNYSSEALIASTAYDHLSQNDKNVVDYENEIKRKNKLNKITKKDTPVETKGFLYSLTARPFSKGTFPEDGFVTLVSENDKKKDGSFGVMEFKRPLSQGEVDKYELRFDGRSENSHPAPQTQEEVPETTNVGEGVGVTKTGETVTKSVTKTESDINIELNKESSHKKEEGFSYDINWYDIKNQQGDIVGNIVLLDRGDYYQVQNAKVETPRKGIGLAAYKQLITQLDKPLYSDTSMTQPAHGLWNKLVAEGLAEQFKENIGSEKKPNIISRYRTIAETAQVEARYNSAPEIQSALEAMDIVRENEGEVPLSEGLYRALSEELSKEKEAEYLSAVTAPKIKQQLSDFDKNNRDNTIDTDIESFGYRIYFGISKGEKKGTYNITDNYPEGQGFYAKQKSISDATIDDVVKFVQERMRAHASRGSWVMSPRVVSKAYIQAKEDGSNPALVAEIDNLLRIVPQEPVRVEGTTPLVKRLKKSDFDGMNESSLNGLGQDNQDAIDFLNEYPHNFIGITESEGGADKITGITKQGGAKIERVGKFALQLNFKNDRTKVMHFKSQEALNAAVDKIYKFVGESVQKPEVENEGGAKEALQNYLANWAENTLRVKDDIMREIREDYDMVLTKLKNMDLIKTDCV